jgi:hypothetical protein
MSFYPREKVCVFSVGAGIFRALNRFYELKNVFYKLEKAKHWIGKKGQSNDGEKMWEN